MERTTTLPLDVDAADRRHRRNKWLLTITLIVLVLAVAWTQGVFDNLLWHVGLNFNDCGQNGFGAVFCGDALTQYQQNFGG